MNSCHSVCYLKSTMDLCVSEAGYVQCDIQTTCRPHADLMQTTCSVTYRPHTDQIQTTCRPHAGHMQCDVRITLTIVCFLQCVTVVVEAPIRLAP